MPYEGKIRKTELSQEIGDILEQINNATNENLSDTVVKRDNDGNFSANLITADLLGNASTANTANKLASERTIFLDGEVKGSAKFDGSKDIIIETSLAATSFNMAKSIELLDEDPIGEDLFDGRIWILKENPSNYALYFSGVGGMHYNWTGFIDLPASLGNAFHNKSKVTIKTRLKRTRSIAREDVFSVNLAGTTTAMIEISFINDAIRVGGRAKAGDTWQSKNTVLTYTDFNNYMIIECTLDLATSNISVIVDGINQNMTNESLSFSNPTFINDGEYTVTPETGTIDVGAIGARTAYGETPFKGYIDWFELYLDDVLTTKYDFNEGSGNIAYDSINSYNATLRSEVSYVKI